MDARTKPRLLGHKMPRALGRMPPADGGGSDVGPSSRRQSSQTHASQEYIGSRYGRHRGSGEANSVAALMKKSSDNATEGRHAGSTGAFGMPNGRSQRGSKMSHLADDYQLRNGFAANGSRGSRLHGASRQEGLEDRQSVSTFGQQRGTGRHSTRGSLETN